MEHVPLGRPRRAFALVAAAVSGCAAARTELVVVVDSDIPIPSELDAVDIEVRGPDGRSQRERGTLATDDALPATLGVAPAGDSLGPIVVTARGEHRGTTIVERRHRLTLRRGESRVLPMHLTRACVAEHCGAERTCTEHGCASVDVDAASLPPWTGDAPRLGAADAGMTRGDATSAADAARPPMPCAEPADCDDGNPCTDDACTSGFCTHAPNDLSCDDGVFCNGFDRCSAGACLHDGDPCTATTRCDEAARACIGCSDDGACPGAMVSAWAPCTFADVCAEGATQTRTMLIWSCVLGSCVAAEHPETRECRRDTDGVPCGETVCSEWSACGGFPDECAETGQASRTCLPQVCRDGVCAMGTAYEQTMGCSRETDGSSCGGPCRQGDQCVDGVCASVGRCAECTELCPQCCGP